MTERADLVVLGGGLAGLSLAMRLVQSGYRGSLRIIPAKRKYSRAGTGNTQMQYPLLT